jgi:hypothetical protein
LRHEGAQKLEVTPCAFEHFALIAGFGAPERVEIKPRGSVRPDECPAVERR